MKWATVSIAEGYIVYVKRFALLPHKALDGYTYWLEFTQCREIFVNHEGWIRVWLGDGCIDSLRVKA
jgi:hypothetical protein